MPVFVALLRAVNVGGTGKLPMSRTQTAHARRPDSGTSRTYIASGNVVAERDGVEAEAKAALEAELQSYAGKPVGVIVRTAAEMAEVGREKPLPRPGRERARSPSSSTQAPPPDALKTVKGQANEEVRLGAREIYVHYPDGIGRSRLRIPAASEGTARNMNTVARLAAMAAE